MSSTLPQFSAHRLILPNPVSSLLHDPISAAVALRHADSSFSLYPSLSPLSHSSFPPLKSLVPPPTSSADFLHLRTSTNPTVTTLFITSSPLLRPWPAILLRLYILRGDRFVKIKAVSNHKDLEFDDAKCGVVFKVNHGVSVKLSAGINVFSLYSVSNSKIWVFAVRLVGDDAVKIMKSAVINCCFPVFAVRIWFGFLVVGEENGVRFFPMHRLVKGNLKKEKKNNGKSEKHSDSAKLRSAKLRQDSKDAGAFFVAFNDKDAYGLAPTKTTRRLVKAISIEALSANYYVVLDSDGDVHLLSLSYTVQGLDNPCIVKRLTRTMKVVQLAVFHDISTATKIIWMSDGCHSVHLMAVLDPDASLDKIDNKETKEKLLQTSVTQAICTSEKIQDIVPLSANSVLILGQGSMFAYAIL